MGSITQRFVVANAADARDAIARAFLEIGRSSSSSTYGLGAIRLRAHQAEAAERLRAAIAEFGGALLCDPVGTGKTFSALAVATTYEHPLVVAPAVLESMWDRASAEAGVKSAFVSHESLSRRLPSVGLADLVIVDEAHHARNPATKRFAALSRIAAGRDVLLLSATPIHNHRRDVESVLSLFLGDRARTLSDAELARCVLRRDDMHASAVLGIPFIEPVQWHDLPCDDEITAALLDLPPPLPARDGGDAGALIVHSLVRQWASSDAAVRAGLMRRKQRAIALISALESGTYPSRSELTSWSVGDDSVQLAFPELVATAVPETGELLQAIRAHHDGLSRLLRMIPRDSPRDAARAALIRELRSMHPDVPAVAFSQYENTIGAMFAQLARDAGVAALTGRGGRVAGGRISRREAIERFAPVASGRAPPRRSEAISLLLTTDLLSEGVNLQDAGVVIHLDLPWTPARMEQRLGRIARIGSHHARVHAYALRPPGSAEAIAGLERALARKMSVSSVLVSDFPSLAGDTSRGVQSEPRLVEALRARIAEWVDRDRDEPCAANGTQPLVAAVNAGTAGFIAACRRDSRTILLCSLDGTIRDDPSSLLRAVELAEAENRPGDVAAADTAFDRIDGHLSIEAALDDAHSLPEITPKQRLLRRIDAIVRHARPHRRSRIASEAGRARNTVLARLDAHGEREMAGLASVNLPDEQWLHAVIECGRSGRSARRPARDQSTTVVGLILFACPLR